MHAMQTFTLPTFPFFQSGELKRHFPLQTVMEFGTVKVKKIAASEFDLGQML